MSLNTMELTRRSFVKGAGSLAAGAALSGSLACKPVKAFAETAGNAADAGEEGEVYGHCRMCMLCGSCSFVATMKDGVVTVNFSKEFKQAMESSDGGQQAVRAILFTCSQFPGVKKVEVQVEGEKIEAQPETAATFINAEEEVIAQYPGVVELD